MLTISDNNALSLADYNELRWSVLLPLEEVNGIISWRPYIDSAVPAQTTIGVGFNIEGNANLRNKIFELLGVGATDDYREELIAAIDTGTSTAQVRGALDAIFKCKLYFGLWIST